MVKKEGCGIYIDVYFFINFAVDYMSLVSVEKLCFLPKSEARRLIGATVGAIYSLAALLYPLPLILHLAAACICVAIVVGKRSIKKLSAGVFIFIGAEIFIGGCITVLRRLCTLIPSQGLLLACIILTLATAGSVIYTLIQAVLKRRLATVSLNAKLWHRGKCASIILMVDSGNLVMEHETSRRVIFVKSKAIETAVGDCDTVFEREKCYVIPIDTASGRGTVMGFIPEKLEFSDKKYNKEDFLIVPDMNGGSFGGYDGIAPLI